MKGLVPSKKKVSITIQSPFRDYLAHYNRHVDLPIQYEDLMRFDMSTSLLDHEGNNTFWETVIYSESERQELYEDLTHIYALLKMDGDLSMTEHLTVARVDYCVFGNTRPFRVRIINRINDNYDHFYVKRADASRVYGLELEHILSPERIMYLMDRETLIEEHIAGVPGDEFIAKHLNDTVFNQIRIAKEFVKFNERCFARLLGDMRSYNYVVDITPDIESTQFRIRAIDFDQQSYEGKKSFYMPQYFKENNPIIRIGLQYMTPVTVSQYQLEERSMMAARIKTSQRRFKRLMSLMVKARLSEPHKVKQLREELAYHHKSDSFLECETMGEIVMRNMDLLIEKTFKQSIAKAK